ncbi:MAG: CPBP family intramembrane metalloprotease [Chlorobi bacterium]|nr:CPBP family intramembrane metalloprotease [Chlorobiota bacterium]
MTEENNNNNLSPLKKSGIEPTMPPGKAAVYALFIVFFLYQFGGGLLQILIFGFDLKDANMNALRLFTAGGQILFILAPALILAKLVYTDVTPILRVKVPNWKEVIVFIVGLGILTPLLQNFIYVQNFLIQKLSEVSGFFETLKTFFDQMDTLLTDMYGGILSASSIFEMILVVLVVAFVPAICEEVFFRGFVQKSFELSIKPFWAIFITSIAFSLYHFNPYGFLALLFLAMFLGFSVYISKSILIPVILHFLNNFVSIIVYFIEGGEGLSNTAVVTSEEFSFNLISLILLSIIFFLFLYFVKKYYYKFTNINEETQ